MKNYYLEAYTELMKNKDSYFFAYESRRKLVRQYSWAFPTLEAFKRMLLYNFKVVEMGAGTGYWAKLLFQSGFNVIAYDISPPFEGKNEFHDLGRQHFHIKKGGPEELRNHDDRMLLLCWPPYDSDMALECLNNWGGDTLVYVGEGSGGCCANDGFFEKLANEFKLIEEVQIPRWNLVYDSLYIYGRRK